MSLVLYLHGDGGREKRQREREIYIYYIHHMFGIFGSNMLIFEMISFWILAIK